MTTETEDLEAAVEVENEAMISAYDSARGNTDQEEEIKPVETAKVDEGGKTEEAKTDEVKTGVEKPKPKETKAEAQPEAKSPEDETRTLLAKIPQLEHSIEKLTQTLSQRNLDKLFGTVGEIQQTIKRIQEGSKVSPHTLRLTKDSLKRLSDPDKGFPDIAALLAEDLAEATAEPEQKPTATETPNVEQLVSERLNAALSERDQKHAQETDALQEDLLSLMHKDWFAVKSSPDFRIWVGTLPAERQQEILTTGSARVFGAALSEFKEREQRASTNREVKNKRLEAAVQPDSAADDASHDQLTEQQAMEAAYAATRRR